MTDRIDTLTSKLAAMQVVIAEAYDELDAAEKAWLPLFDAVAEALREEAIERGSKAAPAEHTILSATRRRYPAEWQRFRSARREVQKLEEIAQNRRAELSGHQTRSRDGARGGEVAADDLRRMRERRSA